MRRLLMTLIVAFSLTASANGFYQVYIGEESYYMWRERDGGTRQHGCLNGMRVGIDRLNPCGWYVGADFLYASGRLNGETSRGSPQSSKITDQIFEARVGFTLPSTTKRGSFFTPFAGWGYFKEINAFQPPSPLPITFTDTFNFVVAGFLSGVNFTPLISMGVNFKVRFMQDAKSLVSDDPLYDDVTIMIEDETLYRVEIPLTFTPCDFFSGFVGEIAPFYEFRHFGGREGFPFNFRDTKFHLLGARLSLIYRF